MRGTETPLITVIVPVYNILDYLPRCVHSITAQTYRRLEILLVDDGSTDGTGELCDRLAGEDERIRVFHKENGGSSSARNLALKNAKGEYVGFVDSDDHIGPFMYERLMNAIWEFQVPAAQTGRDETDEAGNLLPNICEPPRKTVVTESGDFLKELLLHKGDCSFCTKLIRRELFPEEGFPPGKLNEDFHLLVRMLPRIEKLASLPEQDYHVFYRIGSNSRKAERDNFSRVFADSVENADMAAGIVERDYPRLADIAFRFGIFQRLEYLLHIPISQMRRNNAMYREIVAYMRKNWGRSMRNPVLTRKNKVYHTLFAIAPKGVRKAHRYFFLAERKGMRYTNYNYAHTNEAKDGGGRMYRYIKRGMDAVLSLLGLVALSPFLVLLAIAVKIDSRGPVLFKQKRVGVHKKYFSILKFRTMRTDTPKDMPTHLLKNPEIYITRVGAFLRKTSLDELPQIINILKGDMAIVGPRPALWNQDDLIAERDKYGANDILPGLTGWAQINGRDELPIAVKARLDGEYVKKMGLWMDIKCIVGTVFSVARQDGVVEGGTGALAEQGDEGKEEWRKKDG